uniref:Secreted protein n=1 Tax=Ciona intestinalis TaxID=7719 RepID=H2XNK8_CIOIN
MLKLWFALRSLATTLFHPAPTHTVSDSATHCTPTYDTCTAHLSLLYGRTSDIELRDKVRTAGYCKP